MTLEEYLKENDLLHKLYTNQDGWLYYDGHLDLAGTPITSLPDNLSVRGWLFLEGTAITALPDNLKVRGSLDLEGTAITSLPDSLKVGGEIYKDF